jgi:hypothetical protein
MHEPLLFVIWDIADSLVQAIGAVALVVIAYRLTIKNRKRPENGVINF